MEEQRLVVPKEEEEGTENGGRDPLIVQVRTLGDFLTQHGTSHLKPESKDEMHQCWDSQWQEFLKSVAGLPIAPSPLEENAADSQASLGRDKEDPQEESSGEARGKSVLQRDPSMDRKARMGREKLDSSIKVKVEEIQEEVNLESQALLSLRQFSSQDAEEHQEIILFSFVLPYVFSSLTLQLIKMCQFGKDLESMDPDKEHFRKVHLEMCEILKCYHKIYEGIKKENKNKETKLPSLLLFPYTGIKPTDNPQPSTSYASRSDVPENSENHESFKGRMSNLMFAGISNSGGYDANISQIRERKLGRSEGEASLEKKQENEGEANSLNKMSAKRKSYSVEFKKAIVEDSRGKNLTAFCKEKVLDVRMVRKWRAEYKNLSQQVDKGNAKKRKCGSGRQPLFPELEGNICEWIADRRAKALVVRRADIQAFALAMAPQLEISPEFKASQHWLDDFLHRYKLSLKKINNIVQAEH
ncbi:hypothetical protein Chor_011622 [Crotalus horridus]